MNPPELAQACRLAARIKNRKTATITEEKEWRRLLLVAVSKGATRVIIQEHCGINRSILETEIRKARQETDDPELAKCRLTNGGLTLGEYWCDVAGCDRAKRNGNVPFASAQAKGMHAMRAHGRILGSKPLTASMVKRARADESTPTSELAKRWGVSHFALGAARAGKTWRNI